MRAPPPQLVTLGPGTGLPVRCSAKTRKSANLRFFSFALGAFAFFLCFFFFALSRFFFSFALASAKKARVPSSVIQSYFNHVIQPDDNIHVIIQPDDNIYVLIQSYFNHIIQPDDNIHVIIQPDDNIHVIIQSYFNHIIQPDDNVLLDPSSTASSFSRTPPWGWAFCSAAHPLPARWPAVPLATGSRASSALHSLTAEPPMRSSLGYSFSPSPTCNSLGSGDHHPATMISSSSGGCDVPRGWPILTSGTWPLSPRHVPTE
jgi:hypothetical protein